MRLWRLRLALCIGWSGLRLEVVGRRKCGWADRRSTARGWPRGSFRGGDAAGNPRFWSSGSEPR